MTVSSSTQNLQQQSQPIPQLSKGLSLDIWGLVANHLDAKSLCHVSLASKDHLVVALKEKHFREIKAIHQEFVGFACLDDPQETMHHAEYFEFFNTNVKTLKEFGLLPQETKDLNGLKQNLQAFVTQDLARSILKYNQDVSKKINDHEITWPQIQQKQAELKNELLIQAIHHLIDASSSPETAAGLILQSAGCYNFSKVFYNLLSYKDITYEYLALAVINCSKVGRLKFTETLLSKCSLETDHLGIALRCAATANHVGIVRLLLAHGSVSTARGTEAIIIASMHNHLESVQLLLELIPEKNEGRSKALVWAAKNGNAQIVNFLLESGEIDPTQYHEALGWATNHRHFAIIKILMQKKRITEIERDALLKAAVMQGDVEIVEYLIASGPVSRSKIGSCALIAANMGRFDIMQKILNTNQVSIEDRALARNYVLQAIAFLTQAED